MKRDGWQMCGRVTELSACSVHTWLAPVAAGGTMSERLADVLSREERARAARFSDAAAHSSFVAGRVLVRTVLAGYLHCDPGAVPISVDPNGKPLLQEIDKADLHFNLSRSADWVLCAVGKGVHVGADIERVRPLPERDRLMNRFFSPRERLALREQPEDELHAGFFRCWSRKEAYVKARGVGLRLPLDGFSVPLWHAKPGERVGPVRHPDAAETWDIVGTPDLAEHALALCVGHAAKAFGFYMIDRALAG